jgi:poly-gamma-glutamate capsule biosynthesis protein CapA/YwtB (metallophosphatase superfamily)
LRLCAGGDVTLGSNLDSLWARRAAANLWNRFGGRAEPDSMLAHVRPFFQDADVVLVNIEGAIGDGPATRKCGLKSTSCFAFRQPTAAAAALRRLGGDSAQVVGNVANNHSHDAGADGFAITRALLDSVGVRVTGADTIATTVVTARGDTIGVLGFYTGSDTPDARDLAAVRRHVARAVEQFGTVIVTMHLGAEGANAQRTRDTTEKLAGGDRGNPVRFANAAIAAGATAVIGHGPHVLRAGEWRDSSLVLYSLGNLVNYGTFTLTEPMNHGAVACMNIDGPRSISGVHIQSTVQISPGVVLWDDGAGSARLIDSLSRLDFPRTGISVTPDGVVGRRAAADSVRSIPVRKPRV